MPHISHVQLFGLLALSIAWIIYRALQRWSASEGDPFEIRDLFMENGRASKGAVVLMGSFAATTWYFVFAAVSGKMTEGLFGLYGALWIAPVVAKMITGAGASAPAKP